MLKKVMIICLALSFVFIGGIAFAGNGHGPGDGTGEYGPGDCSFTNPDSSIIIARHGNDKGKGDQDKLKKRDGSCLPFTNTDSSIIIAGYDDNKGKGNQDKSRDDSCLDS